MKVKKDTVNIVLYIFRFSLLALFVIGLLALTIVGVNSYRSINERVDSSYATRSSLSYVATKIRQNNRANGVSITQIEDTSVLILSEYIGEKIYETRIYAYDGQLYEDFSESTKPLTLGKGQAITSAEHFEANFVTSKLLAISFGENKEMILSIQGTDTI